MIKPIPLQSWVLIHGMYERQLVPVYYDHLQEMWDVPVGMLWPVFGMVTGVDMDYGGSIKYDVESVITGKLFEDIPHERVSEVIYYY